MSSSIETELLKSGIEGEHTTWKEREIKRFAVMANDCPWRTTFRCMASSGSYTIEQCAISGACALEQCAVYYWIRSQLRK